MQTKLFGSNRPKKIRYSTAYLTKYALSTLKHDYGFNVWRQNNAAVWDPVKKVFRKGSVGLKGLGDIIGFTHDGKFFNGEIKGYGDKRKADQIAVVAAVNATGGLGCFIDSPQALTDYLTARGYEKKKVSFTLKK